MSTASTGVILFDADCGLCRDLAELARRRGGGRITIRAWQEFKEDAFAKERIASDMLEKGADVLRVWSDEDGLLESEAAWAWLVERHPDLTSLNWMAQRLGATTQAGVLLERAGDLLRRLCPRCETTGSRAFRRRET